MRLPALGPALDSGAVSRLGAGLLNRRAVLGGLALLGGCAAPARPEQGLELPGLRLFGEFEPLSTAWLSWDEGHEALTRALVLALHPHLALSFVVPDTQTEQNARALVQSLRLRGPPPRFVVAATTSFYLRDLAVFTRGTQGALGVLDFRWSEYGVAAWCRRRHDGDEGLAEACARDADFTREAFETALAAASGARLQRSSLAIEGGGIECNGQGLLIANEALFLSRNPGMDLPLIHLALLRLPGVRKVIWLPEGLAEDPLLRATITGDHIGWGTGGHTDQFVRFADARTVLLAWPEDDDVRNHPVARLTRARMQRNLEILQRAGDADERPLRVLKVPMPRPIERRVFLSSRPDDRRSRHWSAEHFPSAEGRRQGQPLWEVAVASYLNFVVANGVVVLPDYLSHGTPRAQQERARRVFEQAFAGRQIVWVDAIGANWVGGGLHCATLSQP
jgi:agmatine deiminase